MTSKVLAIVGALVLASPALAQERPKPPPVDQAAALAEAQRLVKSVDGETLFSAGADAGGPVVKHLKSGLVCHFDMNPTLNGLVVFDKGPNRGDDVGCSVHVREIVVTLYANPASVIGDLPKAEAGLVSGVRAHWPDAKPYTGQAVSLSSPGAPPIVVDRFLVTDQGKTLFTRTAAMRLGQWTITQRVTSPEAVALAGDMLGGMMLVNLAREAAAKP
jgi:hypothetical protein